MSISLTVGGHGSSCSSFESSGVPPRLRFRGRIRFEETIFQYDKYLLKYNTIGSHIARLVILNAILS